MSLKKAKQMIDYFLSRDKIVKQIDVKEPIILNFKGHHKNMIIKALENNCLTAKEIGEKIGLTNVQVSRRTSELEMDNKIFVSGTKYDPKSKKYIRVYCKNII